MSFKLFLFIFLVPLAFSSLCVYSNFNSISVNKENPFEIGKDKESCYSYILLSTNKKIILVFHKILSNTAEVLLYKSKEDISMSGGEYKKYLDRFLINENSFKEIDLSNFSTEIFIIIRDSKYKQVYSNNFILYDTSVPITLTDGKPLTIKYFVKDNEYKFDFTSNKDLTFVYSTKVKSKKKIAIFYDNETVVPQSVDNTDHIVNLKSENKIKKLLVSVEDIEEGTEEQEFSVIVYEKNITQFFEIQEGSIYTTNYLSLNQNDEKQIFFFYYELGDYKKFNTINFKLDKEAYKTNYINIQSGMYHSTKSIPDNEKDIFFRFDGNKFPIEYDINSDEYKKLYFQDIDTSFTYRYIYFKIEISKTENYYSPKNFMISIGSRLEEQDYKNLYYYKAQPIPAMLKPMIPYNIKIKIDSKEKYILTNPYPENTIFIKGEFITLDENRNVIMNEGQFTDPDEIIILSGISELSLTIIKPESTVVYFYLEKFNVEDVHIIENHRNYQPFNIIFDEDDCKSKRKKYLLGIYNKQIYSKYNRTYVKYWTSKDGNFEVYYRNGIEFDKDNIFPTNEKYLQKKESTIMLNFFLDFFTFICKSKGTLSLRSPYKVFNETTHMIGQNTILKFSISNQMEILQLTAPMKPPTQFLYFGIFSKYGKKIKISADCPTLFKDTTIEEDQVFLQKIDLYKFESDQLAIKLFSEENTELEAFEVIKYRFTEYTVLDDGKKKKIKDNNIVRFLDLKTEELKVKLKGLKGIEISFGLVLYYTNDVNYLPMAFKFQDGFIKRKTAEKEETMKFNVPSLIDVYNTKKYLAFVLSIPSSKKYEYEAQVIANYDYKNGVDDEEADEDDDDENYTLEICLSVIGIVILLAILGIVIFYFVKKHKNKIEESDNDFQNDNNINNDENNIDSQVDDNNKIISNNNNNDKNNKSKYKYIRSFEDDNDNDKRLYKSFEED